MKNYKEFLAERVYEDQLDQVERYINHKANELKIRFHLSGGHFFERTNSDRNKIDITVDYIQNIFDKLFAKYGRLLPTMKEGNQFVIKDSKTNIVIPVIVKPNRIFAAKTIMQKPNFYTRDKMLRV